MKRRIPGYLVISAFAGLTVVSSTGCLPVFHVPDTAALEEYYSQGVSAEDLALVKPCVMATRESGEQEVRLAEGSAQTALRENI